MTLPALTPVIPPGVEPKFAMGLSIAPGMLGLLSPLAPGSYLHQLVALFAGGNEVVTELVLRLQVLNDGELVQGFRLGALDDCGGDQRAC